MSFQTDYRFKPQYGNVKTLEFTAPPGYSEILDTDFDSDSQSESGEDSSQRSVSSFGTSSVTTMSTVPSQDDVKTPDSTGLTAFPFHLDENAIAGTKGPHLFCFPDGTTDVKPSVEVGLSYKGAPVSTVAPFYPSASRHGSDRKDTPMPFRHNNTKPHSHTPQPTQYNAPTQYTEAEVLNWTPQDVVMWMQRQNLDEELVEKFFINEISGPILLEMQPETLKNELDIKIFAKRHRLMNSIRQLQQSLTVTTVPAPELPSREPTPQSTIADAAIACGSTPVPFNDESVRKDRENLVCHQPQRRNSREERVIGPEDSVSIVGIEQVLPRLHKCSKGEDCRKWQKQHAKLSRLARDLPTESLGSSMVITGDPGNAATARSLSQPPRANLSSAMPPSLVASSDALGPIHPTDIRLSQQTLHEIQPRDAQENVRNFLNFQRLSQLRPVDDPCTPPDESNSSPGAVFPGNLSENLRSLPRLRIPSSHGTLQGSAFSPPTLSGQRTVTPSLVQGRETFQSHMQMESGVSQEDSFFSPSDYYREDPHYEQSTPFSEVDVPLTAVQLGPVERNCSQSVPPDMRFGSHGYVADPIHRPQSTRMENRWRKPSAHVANNPGSMRLNEGRMMIPIETPEDLEHTPRAPHCRRNPTVPTGEPNSDIVHAGWMKKRKNAGFLRHEWQDGHFALRGTELTMYSSEEDSHEVSKALEHIDADDYAVACSSLASSSKLTAALKKTVLKRKDDTRGDTAFAFSLIPSLNNSTSDRKAIFSNGSKSHHFAVKTRDERIDWMRELMLAKALRRGRESGASINVNGTPF
ncbi:Sterile alpha motif type 2 [Penicillium sp. DV-2018c]|nr:Sterile alpha motif type 2 [Penicillium sp. DV-2018c]